MIYRVARTYSHTDLRLLWSIVSRPFDGSKASDEHAERAANDWKNYVEAEHRKEHPRSTVKFFIVRTNE